MADLYYYETGYIDEKYFAYTADAVVDIGPWIVEGYFEPGYIVDYSSQATLSCDAEILTGVTVEASGAWTSQATLAATVYRIQPGEVDLATEFQQVTAAGKIVDQAIDFGGLFSPSITVEVFKNHTAILEVIASMTSDGAATRSANVLLEHIADLNAMAARVAGLSSTMAGEFSQSTQVTAVKEAQAAITAEFTQTSNPINVELADAQIVSSTALSASGFISNKRPRQYTQVGSPTLSTSTKKFGVASAGLSATNYLTVPASTAWNNWRTIDFHVYLPGGGTNGTAFYPLTKSGTDSWDLLITKISTGALIDFVNASGSISATASVGNIFDQWNHIRVLRADSAPYITVWLNGTKLTLTGTQTNSNLGSGLGVLKLGQRGVVDSLARSGYLDELLITNEVLTASSVASFTPLTDRWKPTDQTQIQVLSHFDTDFSDDLGRWLSGAAALTTAAQLTASIDGLTKLGQADFTAFYSQVSTIVGEKTFAADISVESTVSVSLDKIKESTATLESTFATAQTADRIRGASAEFAAFNSELIEGIRVRLATANLTTQFTQSADGTKTKGTSAVLASQTALTAAGTYTEAVWNNRVWFWGIDSPLTPYADNTPTVFARGVQIDADKEIVFELFEIPQSSIDENGVLLTARSTKSGEIIWKKSWDAAWGDTTQSKVTNLEYDGTYLYFGISTPRLPATWRNAVVKVNSVDQTIVWSTGLDNYYLSSVRVDQGNVYVGAGGEGQAGIYKLNSDGTLAWGKLINAASDTQFADITDIEVLGDYVYAITDHWYNNNEDIYKIDKATGSFTQRKSTVPFTGISKDANGYLWLYSENGQIVKINDSWAVQQAIDLESYNIKDLVVDANNEVYVLTSSSLMKLNSDLDTVLWHSKFTFDEDTRILAHSDLTIDAGNKVYFQGTIQGANPDLTFIGRVIKSTGGVYLDSVPFRDGIHSGAWSYSSIDPSDIAAYTPSFTAGTIPSISSVDTNTVAALVENNTVYGDYFYAGVVSSIGSWSSQFTGVFTVGMIKGTSANTQVAAEMSTTGQAVKRITETLPVTASMTVDAVKTTAIDDTLGAEFNQSISETRLRYNDVALAAEFQQTTDAIKFTSTAVTLSSEFTQTAENTRIRDASAAFTAFDTQVTAAGKNATGTVTLDATSELTITANKTADEPHYLVSLSQLTAVNERISYVVINTLAEATVYADVERIQAAGSEMSAEFAQTTNTANSKIVGFAADFTAAFQQTTVNTRTRDLSSNTSADTAMVTINDTLRLANAGLTSQFTVLASPTFIVRITANFTAFNSQLTVGDVINIDPFLQLLVPQETRLGTVLPEQRTVIVEQETRVNIIQGYI